jgi:cytochrome b
MDKILVWDLPTRIGHWLLVVAFTVAWLSGENDDWRAVHVAAGSLMAAVVLYRLAWGVIGSRHARFASFITGPRAAVAYLKALAAGRAPHSTGHNPAAGYAIVALLGLTLVTALAGLLTYWEVGGEAFEELHEGAAEALLALVIVHLAGVAVGSLAHRENLAQAMVTGRKQGPASEAIPGARPLAALVLVLLAVAALWYSRLI